MKLNYSGQVLTQSCVTPVHEHAEFAEFVRNTELSAIATELTQSKSISMYHDHVLVKEPGTRQRTPWHQDQPYCEVEGQQNVSFGYQLIRLLNKIVLNRLRERIVVRG